MGSDDTGKAYADLRKEAFQANMYSSKNQNPPVSFAITPCSERQEGHIIQTSHPLIPQNP